MAIVIKEKKVGRKNPIIKKIVTSSYFEDLKLLWASQTDMNKWDMINMMGTVNDGHTVNFVVGEKQKLDLAYFTQRALLTKKGIQELSEWATRLPQKELEKGGFETQYPSWIENPVPEKELFKKADKSESLDGDMVLA